MEMSLTNLYMGLSTAKTAQNIGIAVMKKVMEQADVQAANITQMLETVNLQTASKIDIKL